MRVLITGGAGFVGTNLCAHLTDVGGYEITVLDNESLGCRKNIAEFPVTFVRGELADTALLSELMPGHQAVVHLAAHTRVMDSIEDPELNFQINVVGSFGLLEVARKCDVKRVVNASTGGAILGNVNPPVHEGMVAQPLSPYGASKLAVEGYLSAFDATYGLRSVSLRFSNLYGPRSYHKGSVVAHFIKRILKGEPLVVYGDGSQVRDYLFTEDLVAGIRTAIDSDINGVIQLGSGQPTTLNELISILRDVIDVPMPDVVYRDFRAGEVRETWCNIDRARRELGFSPGTDLRSGIEQTWHWFRRQ